MADVSINALNGAVPTASADVPLRVKLRRVDRRRKVASVLLVLPLVLLIFIVFVWPLSKMMFNAVRDDTLITHMPRTTAALVAWNGTDLPDENAYAALVEDLRTASENKTLGVINKRMNYELPGAGSQLTSTARRLNEIGGGPYKQVLVDINPIWSQREVWGLLKRGHSRYTAYYLLRSIDFHYAADGRIIPVPPENAVFRSVLVRTLGISLTVTIVTLVLGFPLAYLLATLPSKTSNLLLMIVVLPFWTSVLVRTTAWAVLLQEHGVINHVLIALKLLSEPVQLIYNRGATVIAMSYVQLPLTLLPIYSVMKTISPNHVRAARSLGAGPFYAFWKIYFPQTRTGIAAGCLLTFIACLGYYITPALVGGPSDQMVSYFVAHYTNEDLNWGMASALAAILLATTLSLYFAYSKWVGINQIKIG